VVSVSVPQNSSPEHIRKFPKWEGFREVLKIRR